MNAQVHRQIERSGFTLLKSLLGDPQRAQVIQRIEELLAVEGEQAGEENYVEKGVRRLANLANKGEIFRTLMTDPRVLGVVETIIGPHIRLNMLNSRQVPPHSEPRQPLHADTDHKGVADEKGYYVATAIWMLDDFTRENGATHIVPGSHRTGKVPKQVLADVNAPHPDEVIVEGNAGDVFVFNGHCWHAGGENTTDKPRRAILVHYVRGDQSQRLNYKQAISPEVQVLLTGKEREILGMDDE